MIVRRTDDRAGAFSALPNAVNLAAEGTIIGDGRTWDTVQFVAAGSPDELSSIHAQVSQQVSGDAYVMAVRASMDSITQG
jgi:hypothetical protein